MITEKERTDTGKAICKRARSFDRNCIQNSPREALASTRLNGITHAHTKEQQAETLDGRMTFPSVGTPVEYEMIANSTGWDWWKLWSWDWHHLRANRKAAKLSQVVDKKGDNPETSRQPRKLVNNISNSRFESENLSQFSTSKPIRHVLQSHGVLNL